MTGIGIAGCGNIAHTLAPVMCHYPDRMKVVAAAARDAGRAADFAAEFGIPRSYGSYTEMFEDPDVDLVYVATPHSHHKDIMIDALEHGKHVLCEKAFCVNAKEAGEVFALAKSRSLFVAEAIWTRYMPSRKMINDVISSGKIGRITTISANLGYKILHKPRIAEPELAGGALLDVGVYPLNFVLMAKEGVGIDTVTGSCVRTEKGVDARNMIQINFADSSQAVIYSETESVTDRRGIIYGTEGTLIVENVNNPEELRLYSSDRSPVLLETTKIEHEVNGYEYELLSACDSIEKGLLEDPHMPWSETLRVLRYTDALRSIWDIKLASELNG